MPAFLEMVVQMMTVKDQANQAYNEFVFKITNFEKNMKRVFSKEREDVTPDETKRQKLSPSIQPGKAIRYMVCLSLGQLEIPTGSIDNAPAIDTKGRIAHMFYSSTVTNRAQLLEALGRPSFSPLQGSSMKIPRHQIRMLNTGPSGQTAQK